MEKNTADCLSAGPESRSARSLDNISAFSAEDPTAAFVLGLLSWCQSIEQALPVSDAAAAASAELAERQLARSAEPTTPLCFLMGLVAARSRLRAALRAIGETSLQTPPSLAVPQTESSASHLGDIFR